MSPLPTFGEDWCCAKAYRLQWICSKLIEFRMDIDHINLGRMDLGLLIALDALISEKSVSQAAVRLGIGQSAMSHRLARLRQTFRDDLLVRGRGGMQPTPRALSLSSALRSALIGLQSTVQFAQSFDSTTDNRTFRIGISDHQELALLPSLLAYCNEHAPRIRLQVRSTDRFNALDELDTGRLDIAVGSWSEGKTHHKRRHLLTDTFVCLFDPQHLKIDLPISIEDYVRTPHVLASLREDFRGIVDGALDRASLTRNVVLATPHFLAVPFLLKRAPVISTLPKQLALYFAQTLNLATCRTPIPLPTFAISMLWHSSFDPDPAHTWLRNVIMRLGKQSSIGF